MAHVDITVAFGEREDAEAVLVHWNYDRGAFLRAGAPIAEAMVDKVTLEIQAPRAGYLIPLIAINDVFHPGQAIGRISDEPPGTEDGPLESVRTEPAVSQEEDFVPAPPAVRRYARERGVDLGAVARAFPGRRLRPEDIDTWLHTPSPMPATPYSPFRKALIQRLTDPAALPTTLMRRVAAGPAGTPPLVRFAWAVSHSLPEHPSLNGWATDQGFLSASEVVLGVATETVGGLMVPTLTAQPDRDSWFAALARLRDAVRANRLDQLQFGRPSFVLSNLGPQGVEYFTPRLMVPTVAILGIGAGNEVNFPVSLTFDHRAVDGAEAAAFLTTLDQVLRAMTT
ncbi:MAG: 2-oxo acid dehydrogenase subunit E2 [Thermaerobacter sp.]|nr:2-oxo acid dehydrogenase subunit E2 [Thermaerobacter sp.]